MLVNYTNLAARHGVWCMLHNDSVNIEKRFCQQEKILERSNTKPDDGRKFSVGKTFSPPGKNFKVKGKRIHHLA